MIIPSGTDLTKSTVGILNGIRHELGGEYAAGVPLASDTMASIQAVGNAIFAQQAHQNAFASALMNRIVKEVVVSNMFTSPLGIFKQGIMELGDSIVEIYVRMANVEGYDMEEGTAREFKYTKAQIAAAYHSLNSEKKYPVSISDMELRRAFTTMDGVYNLVSAQIQSLYTAMYYDEFNMMKYIVCRALIDGRIPVKTISEVTDKDTAETALIALKEASTNFTILSDEFTVSGEMRSTPKPAQYVIESSNFNAHIDVSALAAAFNIDKAEFAGNVLAIDNITKINYPRLAQFLATDSSYVEFTDTEKAWLAKVDALLMDKNFYMVFDNVVEMREVNIGSTLVRNYFLHNHKTFSYSPFQNVLCFTHQPSSVTSVSVSPATATVTATGVTQFADTVVKVGFASTDVIWSITGDSDKVVIDQFGRVTVKTGATDADYTITATSRFDATKTDTAVLTVNLVP
jgi:hypothetical protein